jgi:hypothetical protein
MLQAGTFLALTERSKMIKISRVGSSLDYTFGKGIENNDFASLNS